MVRVKVRLGLRFKANRGSAMLVAPSETVRVAASLTVPLAMMTSPADTRPPSTAYTVILAAMVVAEAVATSLVGT